MNRIILLLCCLVPFAPVLADPPQLTSSPTPPMPSISVKLMQLGYNIFMNTPKYAGARYGINDLSCNDCHLGAGDQVFAAPMWGGFHLYPRYSKKLNAVISFEERVQVCFRFSENAKKVPALNSEVIAAIMEYARAISVNVPIGARQKGGDMRPLPPGLGPADPAQGKKIYAELCSVCHGSNGQGHVNTDHSMIPPLWGPRSFSAGADMAQPAVMAKFVYGNMPESAPGSLTPEQSRDVAAFVDSQPRRPSPTGPVESWLGK